MNWNNETVLKFLELYEINSCIWDPQNESHKNRQCVNEAWNNIKANLGIACTVNDLKKKKESLMSAYRHYKTKIKKSECSGSGTIDIYQPTWFAFKCMDGFLGSVYTCTTTKNTEGEETIENKKTTSTTTNQENNTVQKNKTNIVIDESYLLKPILSAQEPLSMTPTMTRQKNPPELIQAKRHMKQAFNFMKKVSKERHHPKSLDDECTIYGHLIARKMRKLSEERRDVMMVKINQLFVDERMVKSPTRPYTDSTITYTPSPLQFQEMYSPQSQTQTASTEEFKASSVAFLNMSFNRRQHNIHPNPKHGASADPLNVQTAPIEEVSPTNDESSLPTRSSKEFIIPDTIYDRPADTMKDFDIFKPK